VGKDHGALEAGQEAWPFSSARGPVLVYLFSFPVTGWSPERWLIGGAPVGYFIVSFALWLVVFIHLLWRDRYYTCPQCGTRVRPFGGTDLPGLNPQPCPSCGLRAPSPPY